MRIAIMGAGGIGAFYGGRLAQAGNDVALIARGDHLKAIQAHGLKLAGPAGEERIKNIQATDDPSSLAPVDVVLFCVKLFDTEDAARAIQPLLAKGGVCISLQNGVDGADRVAAVVGADRVMAGIAYVSSMIESPGVVRYNARAPSIKFGEADGRVSERAARFRDACLGAGFGAEAVSDVRAGLWHKFVGLTVNSAMNCLSRLPAGNLYPDADIMEVARAGFAETAAVGRAMGVKIPDDIVDAHTKNHLGFPPHMYQSMYYDLQRGKRLEVDSLSGYVWRQGRKLGIPTPFHALAYACLKPYANGAPQVAKP